MGEFLSVPALHARQMAIQSHHSCWKNPEDHSCCGINGCLEVWPRIPETSRDSHETSQHISSTSDISSTSEIKRGCLSLMVGALLVCSGSGTSAVVVKS